jgi:hypothetical protein
MASNLEEFSRTASIEAQRLEEDCEYNSTGHFVSSHCWRLIDYWLNFPAALLSAVAAYLAFTNQPIIAGLLAVILTLLTTAAIFLKPGQRSLEHTRAGEKYLALRNRLRIFREIELPHADRSKRELLDSLKALSDKKNEINADSVPLPDWAYKRAKARIMDGGTTHRVDLPRTTEQRKLEAPKND